MTNQTKSARSEDEFLFEYFFGETKRPPVCDLPNLVLANRRPSLALVLDTVRCAAGVWGKDPHFSKHGGPYMGSDEGHDYFRTWGAEKNQQWLRERNGIVNLGGFTMLIDIDTPDEFFDWVSQRVEKDYCPLLDDMQPLIVERIETLRWAYFLLTDEVPLAMFGGKIGVSSSFPSWVAFLDDSGRRKRGDP